MNIFLALNLHSPGLDTQNLNVLPPKFYEKYPESTLDKLQIKILLSRD